MKNKQINKFLLMFFLSFTLFFSVSNAEWTEIPSKASTQTSASTSDTIAGYTLNQIRGFFTTGTSERNAMLESVKKAGYYVLWVPYKDDLSKYYTLVFPISDSVDFGAQVSSSGYFYTYIYVENGYSFYRIDSSSGVKISCTKTGCYNSYTSNSFKYSDFESLIAEDPLKLGNVPYLKTLQYNDGYYWNGTDYYYKNENTSEESDLLTDDSIANIHEILMNSDLSKRMSKNKRYFIVYSAISDSYDVYFYPDVDLVARYFSVDENYKFVSYSNSKTSYIELSQKDMWYAFNSATWYENLAAILNPSSYWKYQLFRKYPHQTSFSYKWEVDGCNIWETPGGLTLDLETQKIIYTSHDIGNMIVEQDGEEYVGSIVEDNSITKPTLINPETGEEYILSNVPESSIEDVGFWENLINFILDKIFNLADALLTVFGANVVTLVFAIAIKSITVLVSSIALIFRFISFIMTLVAIPASSALLAVDVATNSSGLVFTGLNWGTRLIEGLNFIKSVQWNGLGLWTLFEVFVASLEVVIAVKIIRRHYRNL